uniref:Uncharacterized protein n=1 Tax=Arundo donax TaxID=35708 RepID=A0A0A9ACE0_ARUDO
MKRLALCGIPPQFLGYKSEW